MEAGAALQLRAEQHPPDCSGNANPFLPKLGSSKRTQTSHPNPPPVQASRNRCYEFLLVHTIFLRGPLLPGGLQEPMETNGDRRETKKTENVEETDPAALPKLY